MKPTTITILVLFLIPLALAETGCFLYEGSQFHCQNIEKTIAQEECSSLEQCQMETSFQQEKCKVFVGCPNESSSNIILGIIAGIFLITALFFGYKAGLFKKIINWFNKPLPPLPQEVTGIWKLLDPNNSDKNVLNRILKKQRMHKHKIKEQTRKEFFKELGLEIPERKEDEFTKLAKVYRYYEKHKKKIASKLSQKEKEVFTNLEQLIEHSKKNHRPKQEAQEIIDELRKIAEKQG